MFAAKYTPGGVGAPRQPAAARDTTDLVELYLFVLYSVMRTYRRARLRKTRHSTECRVYCWLNLKPSDDERKKGALIYRVMGYDIDSQWWQTGVVVAVMLSARCLVSFFCSLVLPLLPEKLSVRLATTPARERTAWTPYPSIFYPVCDENSGRVLLDLFTFSVTIASSVCVPLSVTKPTRVDVLKKSSLGAGGVLSLGSAQCQSNLVGAVYLTEVTWVKCGDDRRQRQTVPADDDAVRSPARAIGYHTC